MNESDSDPDHSSIVYLVIKLNAHILKLNTMFYYLHLIQCTRVSSPADMTARISYSDMTVLTLHNKRTLRVEREWRSLFLSAENLTTVFFCGSQSELWIGDKNADAEVDGMLYTQNSFVFSLLYSKAACLW